MHFPSLAVIVASLATLCVAGTSKSSSKSTGQAWVLEVDTPTLTQVSKTTPSDLDDALTPPSDTSVVQSWLPLMVKRFSLPARIYLPFMLILHN